MIKKQQKKKKSTIIQFLSKNNTFCNICNCIIFNNNDSKIEYKWINSWIWNNRCYSNISSTRHSKKYFWRNCNIFR